MRPLRARNSWLNAGFSVDHVTLWRWVQRYAQELERRLRKGLKATNDSWRVDETYVRVKGKWVYLYLAVDSEGATIDFLLSAKQDAAAAKRFLAKALGEANHPTPRVINTDKHAAYPPAIVQLKDEGVLEQNCQHRPVQYLNNVLEQDHRAIKRWVRASQLFAPSGELGAQSPATKRSIRFARAKRTGARQGRRSVCCTASFSVCSLRRAKLTIICPDLRLDYKLATHPSKAPE